MNAGRDVEQLVTHWLAEEAEVRAPDRVLESARRTIDRTVQRRWVAAWREPMTLTLTKVATLAAALVVALAGAAWFGRSTAPAAPSATSSPGSLATAMPAVTLESYRAARDEICLRYRPLLNPLKVDVMNMYDPSLSETDRADKIAALAAATDRIESLAGELGALPVPQQLAAEHRDDVASLEAQVVLFRAALAKLDADPPDLAGAQANDEAADVFAGRIAAYESRYRFLTCP